MARAIVMVGTPRNIEERTFEYKNGDKAGTEGVSLSFILDHPATALAGAVSCDTNDAHVIEQIKEAAETETSVTVAAVPRAFRYEREGKVADWVKMNVKALV